MCKNDRITLSKFGRMMSSRQERYANHQERHQMYLSNPHSKVHVDHKHHFVHEIPVGLLSRGHTRHWDLAMDKLIRSMSQCIPVETKPRLRAPHSPVCWSSTWPPPQQTHSQYAGAPRNEERGGKKMMTIPVSALKANTEMGMWKRKRSSIVVLFNMHEEIGDQWSQRVEMENPDQDLWESRQR